MKKTVILLLSFFILIIGFHLLLTQDSVYHNSIGLITQTYHDLGKGKKLKVDSAYTQISNENLVQWDAVHYQFIKDQGYAIHKPGGDFIFAFFPLFPTVWKLSGFNPMGISIFNYILFAISILMLVKTLSERRQKFMNALLCMTLPCLVIFFIPYTESLFLLCTSLALYGIVSKRYSMLFVGLFLAAITRPAYTILFLALFGTELLLFLEYGQLKTRLKSLGLKTLPLALGTAVVSLYQMSFNSGHPFKFIQVQKYWDNVFQMPKELYDWSQEGFAINVVVLGCIAGPAVIYLAYRLVRSFKLKPREETPDARTYIFLLSIFYMLGASLFILFFRGGSLHCMFRFALCPPFAFVVLILGIPKLEKVKPHIKWLLVLGTIITTVLIFNSTSFSSKVNFLDFGGLIMLFSIALLLFKKRKPSKLYFSILYIVIFFNLIWTGFLINNYITNAWIFA